MSPFQFRRVLFVAYQFPPVGGVGVHRVTKFVKYLPEFGWNSSVLTVSNPSVPLQDDSLLRDIPPGTILRRARTFEPGYGLKQSLSGGKSHQSDKTGGGLKSRVKSLVRGAANLCLQPDSQVLWHPHAYRTGLQLLRDLSHDAILATGPPFSSFLLGAKLARKTGLPLLLDYRDEWDISNAYWENKSGSTFANWLQSRQQNRVLKAAEAVFATTPSSTRAVEELARQAGSFARCACIYNGYDPDDFLTHPVRQKRDYGNGIARFRLAFIGTLWNLNSIEPVVAALERLNQQSGLLAAEIELLVAGRRTEQQEAILSRLEATSVAVTRLPFVAHDEAIHLMTSADALLMLNSNVPKAERIINAKTFEYMAAKRCMFVVAPRGDVWDLVSSLPGTVLCEPQQISDITERLALLVEQYRCGIEPDDANWDISRFERRQLTGQLAEHLDRIVLKANLTSSCDLLGMNRPRNHQKRSRKLGY